MIQNKNRIFNRKIEYNKNQPFLRNLNMKNNTNWFLKNVVSEQDLKEAGLKQWGMAAGLGLAALNGAPAAHADMYDGSTQGNKAVATNASQADYDESKLTPAQKAKLDLVKKLHNDSDQTNNKAFIQNKIKFLQNQIASRKATILKVQQKVKEATKAGDLEGAMSFKNYADKVLTKEVLKLQEEIKELKGENVKQEVKNDTMSGSFKSQFGTIVINKDGSVGAYKDNKKTVSGKLQGNNIVWSTGGAWKNITNNNGNYSFELSTGGKSYMTKK